jgi:hypothetical protein
VITDTISVVVNGDVEYEDETSAYDRAREVAEALRQLAQDIGLQYVSADAEVEEL